MIAYRSLALRRLVTFSFLLSLLSVLGGCIIRTEPAHRRSHRRSVRHHGSHQHCHYQGGPHRRRVCHSHPHSAGHH